MDVRAVCNIASLKKDRADSPEKVKVGLEKGELVDLNISDFPLKSNSTACKIKSPRPNASF